MYPWMVNCYIVLRLCHIIIYAHFACEYWSCLEWSSSFACTLDMHRIPNVKVDNYFQMFTQTDPLHVNEIYVNVSHKNMIVKCLPHLGSRIFI